MDLHVGAGARTKVRMRQRQEIRRRNLAVGAAVATPGVIIGIWTLTFGGLFTGEDVPQEARTRSVSQTELTPSSEAPGGAAAQLPGGEQLDPAAPDPADDESDSDSATGTSGSDYVPAADGEQPTSGVVVTQEIRQELAEAFAAPTSPSLGENSGPAAARNTPSSEPTSQAPTSQSAAAQTSAVRTTTQSSAATSTSTTPSSTSQTSTTTTAPTTTTTAPTYTSHTHPWDTPSSTTSTTAPSTTTTAPSTTTTEPSTTTTEPSTTTTAPSTTTTEPSTTTTEPSTDSQDATSTEASQAAAANPEPSPTAT